METVSNEWKEGFARAQRAEVPSAQTRQIVNILNAMDVPVGISISQELASFFVQEAQKRGLTIPATQLSSVEKRNFEKSFKSKCSDFDPRIDPEVRKQILAKGGIIPAKKPVPQKEDNRYRYWTDDMLHQMNILHQQVAEAEAERQDPLLGLAKRRGTPPIMQTKRKK